MNVAGGRLEAIQQQMEWNTRRIRTECDGFFKIKEVKTGKSREKFFYFHSSRKEVRSAKTKLFREEGGCKRKFHFSAGVDSGSVDEIEQLQPRIHFPNALFLFPVLFFTILRLLFFSDAVVKSDNESILNIFLRECTLKFITWLKWNNKNLTKIKLTVVEISLFLPTV